MRVLLALICVLAASPASAQRFARVEAPPDREAALEDALAEAGWRSVDRAPTGSPPIDREGLAAVARAESLIARARSAAARLREGAALAALAEARRLLEGNAHVPGVARWLAELELVTGVVAHQRGATALAEQSLVRAASLDPTRRLGAAEAPPAVVQRADTLAREAATRPRTELPLRATTPAGARAFLDDRPVGPLPAVARPGVGRHVLRIEAPGHRPWARVVDLAEGRHRPWVVTLSPTPVEAVRRRLAAAELAKIPRELPPGAELVWVEARDERAIVTRCETSGCTPPARIEGEEALLPPEPSADPLRGPALADRWTSAVGWLEAPELVTAAPEGPRPWWRRGTTWVAAAIGVIVVGVALGFSLRREPEQRFRAVIDTTDF